MSPQHTSGEAVEARFVDKSGEHEKREEMPAPGWKWSTTPFQSNSGWRIHQPLTAHEVPVGMIVATAGAPAALGAE
jgi:hypothetical protein